MQTRPQPPSPLPSPARLVKGAHHISTRVIFIFSTLLLIPFPLRAQPRFQPPTATFDSPATLRSLKSNLDTNPADAAAAIEALLKTHPDALTPLDEETLISISSAIDLLDPSKRQPLLDEYRRLHDAAAQDAYDEALQEQSASIDALYAVARRYPLSSIAPRAYADAASRAARIGDAPTALALFARAHSAGWKPDPVHTALIDAMSALVAVPADAYRGPIPFDAPWFSRPDHAGLSRSIPLAFDNTLYFAGPRHVLAISKDNKLLWRFAAADAWAPNNTLDRPISIARGPTLAPTLFASPTAPQVLIVRQPRGLSRDMVLRALRASDGTLLWSTDANPALESTTFVANPTLAGRYVYAVAIAEANNERQLLLIALDLLDGHILFKTSLGQIPPAQRGITQPWDPIAEHSEPLIADDTLYLAPCVGVVYAIDRFDGKIRWTAAYDIPTLPAPPAPGRGAVRIAPGIANPRGLPVDSALLLRYRGTPHLSGDALVVAPQDTTAAFALDRLTGRQLWKNPAPPGQTLIASNASLALFAGLTEITALDSAAGAPRWTWTSPPGLRLSGPPAQFGDTLFLPTSDGRTLTLSISTGKPNTPPATPPPLKPLITTNPARKAIDEAFLLRSFAPTTPPAPRSP